MPFGRSTAPAAAVLAVLALAGAAAAGVGLPLTGETLTAGTGLGTGVYEVTVDCHPEATSTIHFHTEGVAFGPYPGTFVEDGRATQDAVNLGRPGFTGGRLLSFESSFTIYGADGTLIVGEKTLDPATSEADTGLGSEGNCLGDQESHLADIRAHTFYTATLQFPDGTTATDSGRSFVIGQSDTQGFVPDTAVFEETYTSTVVPPPPPGSTAGRVNGGGRAGSLTFGVLARSDEGGLEGGCNVVEQATDRRVRCLTVDTFVRVGQHATMRGDAEVDGVATRYRIELDDLCDPGAGCDTFTIQTDSGFTGGGVLDSGNVKVRD